MNVTGWPAIQQCCGHLGIPEDRRPFAKGAIDRDDDRGASAEAADEMEEQLRAASGKAQEADVAKLRNDFDDIRFQRVPFDLVEFAKVRGDGVDAQSPVT